jgi:hypothetical protein
MRPSTRNPQLRWTLAVLVAPLVVALAGCDMAHGPLTGRATDEWTHTYPLAAGGEVRIGNTNGRIEVEGVEGTTLEVRAERIARAATDDGARELLPRISIKEDAKPDRVTIETERMSGIMLGASFEVRYFVRAPKNASINVSNTNGVVTLKALAGKVNARTTNGAVNGRNLVGTVEARTTNGGVNMDFATLGPERVTLQTTNGGVTISLPESAKADVTATWTNGGISLSNLKMEVSERGRRRFEGKMNGGGTAIDLHTTNGGIRIKNHADTTDAETDPADKKPTHTELERR